MNIPGKAGGRRSPVDSHIPWQGRCRRNPTGTFDCGLPNRARLAKVAGFRTGAKRSVPAGEMPGGLGRRIVVYAGYVWRRGWRPPPITGPGQSAKCCPIVLHRGDTAPQHDWILTEPISRRRCSRPQLCWPLPAAILPYERRAIVHRRKRCRKPVQFFSPFGGAFPPFQFNDLSFECVNNLGVHAAPLFLGCPLDGPIDFVGNVFERNVHGTILEP